MMLSKLRLAHVVVALFQVELQKELKSFREVIRRWYCAS